MKIFIFLKISLIAFAFCKLSPFQIKEVIKNMNISSLERKIVESSIINPVFGYLFESTGALNNLRFYGASINAFIENGNREYSRDTGKDSLSEFLIELFPSPTGTISYIRNITANFGYKFDKKKSQGIKFLATMFAEIIKSNNRDIQEFSEFEKIKKLVLDNDNQIENLSSIFNSKIIKLMSIHTFILNVLDNNKDLELYLSIILDTIKGENVQILEIDCNILDAVLEIETKLNDFPYSKLRQPPSSAVIPFYYREINKFSKKKSFSDCAEIVLLELCNCLFYVPEHFSYSTKGLGPDTKLAIFYTKYDKLFTISLNVRKEWSRVVQGLDDFKNNDKSRYKTNILSYRKAGRNEINPGIINMMNFLMKICEVDNASFWSDFNGKKLDKKLKQLFKIISPRFQDRILVDTSNSNFKEFKSQDRYDFEGSFNLVFTLPSKNKIIILVEQTSMHASLEVLDSISENKDYTVTKSPNLPILLFQNFVTTSRGISNIAKNMEIFTRIYFTRQVQTNEGKRAVLLDIFDILTRYSLLNSDIYDREFIKIKLNALRVIAGNILSTVNLNDIGTRYLFKPFLLYNHDLKVDEIVDCWMKSLSFTNLQIFRLWEIKVQETNIESLKLEISEMTNSAILNLFNTLRKLASLKSLHFDKIHENGAEIISRELSEMTQLTSLSFKDSWLVKGAVFHISKSLGKLSNLKSINFSRSYIGNTGIEYILCEIITLKNLETLNFSKNNINGGQGIQRIANLLKECRSLKSLDLSGNKFDSVESAKLIIQSIGELSYLETLDLSNSLISKEGVPYIEQIIKRLPKLKSINLSNNLLGEKGSEIILETSKEFLNLIDIDLSNNTYEDKEKSNEIPKIIKMFSSCIAID